MRYIIFFCFLVIIILLAQTEKTNINLTAFKDIVTIITGIFSTGAAIFAAYIAYSFNNNSKNQKEQYILQSKRENYASFIKIYLKYMSFERSNNPKIKNSKEYVQVTQEYVLEITKLNIYASKEIIDYIFCTKLFLEIWQNISELNQFVMGNYNDKILVKIIEQYFYKNIDKDRNFIIENLKILKEKLVPMIDETPNLKAFNEKYSDNVYCDAFITMYKIMTPAFLLGLIRKDLKMGNTMECYSASFPLRILINDEIIPIRYEEKI